MKTINLNELTDYEKAFVTAGVNEWNDLMFTDDLNHGIPKASLGGVVASLVKKRVIAVYEGTGAHGQDIGEFQFLDENGNENFDEPPTLV